MPTTINEDDVDDDDDDHENSSVDCLDDDIKKTRRHLMTTTTMTTSSSVRRYLDSKTFGREKLRTLRTSFSAHSKAALAENFQGPKFVKIGYSTFLICWFVHRFKFN